MQSLNMVVLTANLTKDPELRTTGGGTSLCKLRVAVNTRRKAADGSWGDKPNYFDVTVWGQQGENCATYLAKGSPVAVQGRLEWREWDATDGSGKRQAVEIVAESVTFLPDGRDHSGQTSRSQPSSGDFGTPAAAPAQQAPSSSGSGNFGIPTSGDDDIPF